MQRKPERRFYFARETLGVNDYGTFASDRHSKVVGAGSGKDLIHLLLQARLSFVQINLKPPPVGLDTGLSAHGKVNDLYEMQCAVRLLL